MKHLISATLSMEAGQVWESWPKGQRSKMLSELLADDGTIQLQRQADLLMIGSLRGNIATHRRRIIDFMNEYTPLDSAYVRMFRDIIQDMNEDLAGSIHHEPISQTGRPDSPES
jgi:hypothetical protein